MAEGEVAPVDADVQWMVDRARIRELTARYNRCFDDGDPDGFAACFTEDGKMEVTGTFEVSGRPGLADMVRHTPYGVVHVTVDAIVTVDGDTAVQDVTMLVLARPGPDAPAGSKTKLTNSGRYRDELVRTPDGWRFRVRRATLDGGR
jgi:uncharacterized protein (TIGR02246 family)